MSATLSAHSMADVGRGGSRPALAQLAEISGVQTSYVDMAGRRQLVHTDVLLAVLRALGVPIERANEAPQVLRQTRRGMAGRVLEPVHVLWKGRIRPIPLRLPRSVELLSCCWHLENGGTKRFEMDGKTPHGLTQASATRWLVSPPRHLPTGYHRLTVESSHFSEETHVFCAHERCHGGNRSRGWGMFAPHYALHGAGSWGGAGYHDLASFIAWIREQGGSFFGMLPMLPQYLDRPFEPSPYSPVSRLFWNDFLLDIASVPEFEGNAAARRLVASTAFQNTLQELRRLPEVDYRRQAGQKRKVLEILAKSFFARRSERRRELEAHARANPRLWDYARFRAVQEERGGSWRHWPSRMQRGELLDSDCRPSLLHYHLYVQWLAEQQMAKLSDMARRKRVDLYLDVPLGAHRDGYDSWRHQDIFVHDVSGGAPPDPVFTQGQDWGFAPLHPAISREQGHAYVRSCLQHHFEHARMLRFDHVMGLHRLYHVPRGMPPSCGAYVAYPAEEFYAMLSIESHRHHAAVIGENLGTLPPGVNRALSRHGVSGMWVVQYEVKPKDPVLPRIRPAQVASMNTHDMPPFAAFWNGLDIDDHADLGLIPSQHLARCRASRQQLIRALVDFLKKRGLPAANPAEVYHSIFRYLGASRCRWLMVNLEDLWLETASQNTPGTSTERVNWRRKARWSLDQLREGKVNLELLQMLREIRPC